MSLYLCVSGCDRYLGLRDGHERCIACLGLRDGHERCIACLGIEHAEAAFVDESCTHCGRMTILELRSRLSFLQMGRSPCASAATARRAVGGENPHHSHPPLLLPAGSSVEFENASKPPPALWNQVSVAQHTQTPLRAASGHVLRAEIAVLLAKDAIEPVPPTNMRSGYYSPYFIVPKKGCGLLPILDLRVLNWSLYKLPFKMLTQKRIFE
ncbi:hypothetical protein PO909_030196 [Leuciscus waleckii]